MSPEAADGAGGWDRVVDDHKRRQLLHIGRTAADLVSNEGLSAVSMSRLARAAGVSRATLYNYVPDVATAIRAYLSHQTDEFYSSVAAALAEETGPEARLRRYIREQVAYVAGTDHRAAVALSEVGAALGGEDSDSAHRSRRPDILEAILSEGVRDGVFRPAPYDVQALLVGRLLYSAHELLHQRGLGADDVSAAITDLVLGGVLVTAP